MICWYRMLAGRSAAPFMANIMYGRVCGVLVFSKETGFNKYLYRMSDAGSGLVLIRSGTHELNEDLGRQRGRRESRMYLVWC